MTVDLVQELSLLTRPVVVAVDRMRPVAESRIMDGDMRFALALAALPLIAQHGNISNESKNPAIGNPQSIVAGAKLYATSCGGCHGPDGSGGRGPNLVNRALWHPLTDEAIFNAIRNGVPAQTCPRRNCPMTRHGIS